MARINEGSYISSIEMTERIKSMRKVIVSSNPSVCSERAMIVTESYQKTEGEPIIIRRAKAIKAILENMTLHIWDNELIVGNHANGRRTAPIFPEWGVYWLEDQLDIIPTREQDRMDIPEQVKQEIRSILPYWKGKTVYDKVWGTLPEEAQKARAAYIFTLDLFERGSFGHMAYDTPSVLENGIISIKKDALSRIAVANIGNPDELKKVIFWKAIVIICDGIVAFANRYAVLAEEMAKSENNIQRKNELLEIARICSRVPERPAESFREAIQTAWFLQLLPQLEGNGNSVSMGRLDQHLYPYYKKDIEAGKLTIEQAQELTDCLWLKLNEIVKCWDTEAAKVHAGFPMTQNITIGGQNSDGTDATNELTYHFLNTQDHIRLASPQFVMRVHSGMPDKLLTRACEVIRSGGGMPALFGDEAVISSLMHVGVPLEEARNGFLVGCVEPSVIGAFGRNNGGYFNLARIVDCALNNGRDRLTGELLGVETGDPRDFKSFEDLKDAVKKQMAYFVRLLVIENHIVDLVQSETTPHILASTIIPGCIEHGKDITQGGAYYHWTPPYGAGIATASDSLSAIKSMVFDEKRISMDTLLNALDTNFEGMEGEKIRQILLHAPKYGNDDDRADEQVRFVSDAFYDELEKYPTMRGQHFVGGFFVLSGTVPFGRRTGATADGRKARAPISDSIAPTNGADQNGPTSVLCSASKIDHGRCTGGNILNIKFTPSALESAGNFEKFSSLLKTYLCDLKGFEVQVNVVSEEMLRNAQKTPEEYRDLIIRVAGYSARFIELSKDIQDDIIARTENVAV